MSPQHNLDAQAWQSPAFLQNVLETNLRRKVKVTSLDIKPAVAKGENFLSQLFRVQVSTEEGEMRLMVKTTANSQAAKDVAKDLQVFEKEFRIYRDVLPKMYDLWKERAPEVEFQEFGCRCYINEMPNTIIMDDLTAKGYQVAERSNRLDFDHCSLVVKTLAKYHATSIPLLKNHPELRNEFKEMIFVKEKLEQNKEFMTGMYTALGNVVEKWQGFERFGEKFRRFGKNGIELIVNDVMIDENTFVVLNHGDCWVNNFMFKYSKNGVPEDLKFVDFQIAKLSSPLVDLTYFVSSSAQESVMVEDLLELYHKTFKENLIKLQCGSVGLNLEETKAKFYSMNHFAFHTSSILLPIVLSDPEDAMDMDDLRNPKMFERCVSGSRFKETYSRLLVRHEKLGTI